MVGLSKYYDDARTLVFMCTIMTANVKIVYTNNINNPSIPITLKTIFYFTCYNKHFYIFPYLQNIYLDCQEDKF